jgi:hypothetical protein
VGHLGLFQHGARGSRVHHNTIERTTVWNEPESQNGSFNTFAMGLGGFCADDNEFSDNTIIDAAGIAIHWNGATETVECGAGGCTPVAAVGNTIRDTTIAGTCLEKDTSGTANVFGYGSIHTTSGAGGTLYLEDNTLGGSECRFAISAYGQLPGVEPLDLRVSGGSYASGPNAANELEDPFYCGALHAHGNRKIVLGDDVTITNEGDVVPKACLALGATLVVHGDPFASGGFSEFRAVPPATVVECDQDPENPECQ